MRLAVAVPIALLLFGPAASLRGDGENMISNPGFTQDLSGWFADPEASATWSALDADGSSTSGSVLLTNVATDPPHYAKLSQCVPVDGPTLGFALRYRTRVPSSQYPLAEAQAIISAFATAGCTGPAFGGPAAGGGSSGGPGIVDEWLDSPGGFLLLGTDWPVNSVLVTLIVPNDRAGRSVQVHFDDVSLTPLVRMTIPASASREGLNGAFFRTDLSLFNSSRWAARVDLFHFCIAGQPCRLPYTGDDHVVVIPPRSTIVLRDVLATLGHQGTAGAIELIFEGALRVVARSRTYSSSSVGATIGTTIPALPEGAAHTRAILVPLSSNGSSLENGFRTNVGVYNPNASSVDVHLSLFAGTGEPIGTPIARTWAPKEPFQIDDVFSAVAPGMEVPEGAFVVVQSTAPVFSYAIVIDNQSSDPTFIHGADDARSTAAAARRRP